MAHYPFPMGHICIANSVIEMIQVSTEISSWTQNCTDSSAFFFFFYSQLFKEPGEVK